MRIKHIEIANFRKLLSVRIDLAEKTTVFVGANNSGKTSATVALQRFLVDPREFSVNDLTLSHRDAINAAGALWDAEFIAERALPAPNLQSALPFLDIWFSVSDGELHRVQKIIPTLDWNGGLLGVRLRYEPEKPEELQQEFLATRKRIADAIAAAAANEADGGETGEVKARKVNLWPESLIDFLDRRMRKLFRVNTYLLDPAKLAPPADGAAKPQQLADDAQPVEGDPLKGLIRVNEISAQRGFGQREASRERDGGDRGDKPASDGSRRRLSRQLRDYFDRHLDPTDTPGPDDFGALEALETARKAFDLRLETSFKSALEELEGLGYPGVTDPKLTISSRVRLTDGLDHDSAVQYEVPSSNGDQKHLLPEDSNGLGFQNLVSMVFRLMSFRDAWMRVGKAAVGNGAVAEAIPPLHLVLIEEPEAHLHAQVQQVFITQAYDVLRAHPDLRESTKLTTQLVVSTHSSHLAHACDFASLRYFRRHPESVDGCSVPTSRVVNLSEVFGAGDQTTKFVIRYIKASHCDLFFADAAIFVEGSGERILVPHFIEENNEFKYLRRCYLTWLEIGGSHAHRLRGLIEHLGLTTLIVTDLDAKDELTNASEVPQRGSSQVTRNETLRTWAPGKESIDELLDLTESAKEAPSSSGGKVRVAYQMPTRISFKGNEVEALANTFEDALLYQNLVFFVRRQGAGLFAKFREALERNSDVSGLARQVQDALRSSAKAEFALDLLFAEDSDKLAPPSYIAEGLSWLTEQLRRKDNELSPKAGRQ
jgi:predicted ATP-dependent endonuclease of OLD family